MHVTEIVLDNFFDEPNKVRDWAVARAYRSTRSPDGMDYPDISIELPLDIAAEFHNKLVQIMGRPMKNPIGFFRLSKKGVHVPHQVHTDANLGQYTALVYLNTDAQCQGGTSLHKHVSGMDMHPTTPEQEAIWKQDTNDATKWEVVGGCPMKFNRLCILDSRLFHRADPVGGYGDNNENGRLVLICFFTLL